MKINLIGKEIQIKKEIVISISAVAISALTIIGFLLSSRPSLSVEFEPNFSQSETVQTEVTTSHPETTKREPIKVYVTGCVNNPGIYELEKGQVIYDAITAAGGFTEDADKNINLVYKLYDNVTLRIKSVEEKNDSTKLSGIEIIDGDSNLILDQNGSSGETSYGKLNLNTATSSQLATLPGIGESTAQNIVNYRNQIGGFAKIEDIMNVTGIKENKFNQIKDYITVD